MLQIIQWMGPLCHNLHCYILKVSSFLEVTPIGIMMLKGHGFLVQQISTLSISILAIYLFRDPMSPFRSDFKKSMCFWLIFSVILFLISLNRLNSICSCLIFSTNSFIGSTVNVLEFAEKLALFLTRD